jgi:hypothetical protein
MGGTADGPKPLGDLREVRARLAAFNTSGDGTGPDVTGLERLHGPGMVVEIPTAQPTVQQAIATLNDEDYAFPVLVRMCRELGWKMMDLETGRVFG